MILETARAEFSAYGFEGTTMRAIAQATGVDAALIHHFFLSKGGLFTAAIQDVFNVPDLVPTVVEGPAARAGERLARAFLSHWEGPQIRPRIVSVLRSATAFEGATAAVLDFLGDVLVPVTTALGHGKPELRASLAGSHLLGVASMRYVIRNGPISSMDLEQLVGCVAAPCQSYLDGRL